MGNNLFGANIAGKLAAAIGSKLLPVVLKVPGAPVGRDANDPLAGNEPAAPTSYNCRGFEDKPQLKLFDRKTIQAKDTAMAILGDTIAGGSVKPQANYRITFQGRVMTVIAVEYDPDAAMYICQCRG